MNEEQLRSELRELGARLSRLERWAGLAPFTPPEEPRAESAEIASRSGPVVAPMIAAPPAVGPVALPPRSIPDLQEHWARGAERRHEVGRLIPQDAGEGLSRPAPQRTGPSLEILIGERWMAWVGAIVVVLAVGFFVKLAYDMGWWGRLPPLAKCFVCAGFGSVLVIGGEVAMRRVSRMAAVSLFGAGLGTLYLTAYATFRYFDLLAPAGAFWLMLLVAALGFGITWRGKLVAIGILSLLGGYLSPILLSEQVTFAAALPLYVTALLFVALGLSAALPGPFRTLRYVGVVLHMIVGSLWLLREGTDHWLLAMSFLTLWWGLVTGEALLAALRGQSAHGNSVVSLFFTFWYVAFGCDVLAAAEPGQRNWLGLFAAVVAAVCAWIALPLGSGLIVLRDQPRQAIDRLAVTLWAEVGILIAAAIGVQFREQGQSFGQSIGWLVMGVACIEVGRRLPSRGVDAFGLIIGALGCARVWVIDWSLSALQTVAWSYGDVTINYWSLLALGSVAATMVVARRLRTDGDSAWARAAGVLTFLSALQWMALCVASCHHLALTAGWLLAVVALLLAAPLGRGPGYRRAAIFVLVATMGKWLLLDAVATRWAFGWNPSATLPLLNWQMAAAVAICCCTYWVYRARGPAWAGGAPLAATVAGMSGEASSARQSWLVSGTLFLLVALSFEVEHALAWREVAQPAGAQPLWDPLQTRLLWWTLLWATFGLFSFLWGSMQKLRMLTDTGWFLLIVAGGTWLAYDTLFWRLERGVVLCPVVFNVQFGVGVALMGLIGAAARLAMRRPLSDQAAQRELVSVAALGLGFAVAIGLWLGSLELDRFFAPEAARVGNPAMARQTALSVYWGIYAIALIALGFWRRAPWVRYGGLGLLAVTLGKVMIVDLAKVQYVYRVLSLLAVGLLFIGTSIAYARLASRLAAHAAAGKDA